MNQDLGMLGNNYDDDDDDYDGADGGPFREVEIREQDRFLPVANIARIMKKVLPNNAKIAKDAKESIQECVSEFISFITSEASDKCQQEKRKTINGDDILWAMTTLGFDKYVEPLKVYLAKYRESVKGEKPEKKPSASARAKESSSFTSLPSPKTAMPMQSGSMSTPVQSLSHLPPLGVTSGDGGLKYGGEPMYPAPGYAGTSSGAGHPTHPTHSGMSASIPLQGGLYQSSYLLSGGGDKSSVGIAIPPGTGYVPSNAIGLSTAPGLVKSPYPSIQPMFSSPMVGNSMVTLPLAPTLPLSAPLSSAGVGVGLTASTPVSSSTLQYPPVAPASTGGATTLASFPSAGVALQTPTQQPVAGQIAPQIASVAPNPSGTAGKP